MKMLAAALVIFLVFLGSACQRHSTVCPEGSITYWTDPATVQPLSLPASSELIATPILVEIRGKMKEVDRLISGPVCSDTWEGTIYVGCDIQIAAWEETPDFFVDCPLTIKPKTKVYVAAHNDSAYYKGCSCHSGELANP